MGLESVAAANRGEIAATYSRGVEAVNRRLRFRFSLATLLIAMAWSTVVVYVRRSFRTDVMQVTAAPFAATRRAASPRSDTSSTIS